MYILVCYIRHLASSFIATVWVAQTLVRNGRAFLIDAFHGNVELADLGQPSVVVGFYLISVGNGTRARTPAPKSRRRGVR
jgi:hypothetical protein